MILPSLRRMQPAPEPPPPGQPAPEPPRPAAVGEPGVLGYVVVATEGCEMCLTNADLMDRESAEREAALWRQRKARHGISRGGPQYTVCAVIPAGRE